LNAAVVVVPIAIQTALQLGLNPHSFAVMIALGASCSFLTPLEPFCMMWCMALATTALKIF